MRNFRNWDVYKNAKKVVVFIYSTTEQLPDSEKYGLTNQLRRASISIVANIAEGAGRSTERDFKHFLTMSLGSSFEVEALLEVSADLNLIEKQNQESLLHELGVIQKQLNAFITKLK
ncbi:four helix bundle protein [Salibacter halophilus]|uniref:Four helix bundle protein n=1 Tax=Salibacter halophilus TaxID=1803916 RepID=A0A6N6M306_9FLAO|nr:four helix bundle protein [Salibacter halophilus]KAB1063530.1 four helix bundle protein [Salibacter halophilus]